MNDASHQQLINTNDHLREDNACLRRRVIELEETVEKQQEKLEAMNYRITQLLRFRFGRRSEDVPGQLYLDLDLPELAGAAAEAADGMDADETDGIDDAASRPGALRKKKTRGGRLRIPDHVPHRDVVIEPDPADLVAPDGRELVLLRQNVCTHLEYRAAAFEAIRVIRPVYGLPDDDGPGVCAEPPPRIVAGGLAGDSVLAMLLCEKYDLHNPLYRQQDRCARAGLAIPRSTMVNWVLAATGALGPVVEAMATEVRSAPVIGLDDTTMPRQCPGKGRTHTGRFWGFLGGRTVVVRYAESREGIHAKAFLEDWEGPVVADAFKGHESLYEDGRRWHLPCWAHVRRKFVDAWRDGGDERARPFLKFIGALYRLERQTAHDPPDRRRRRRQEIALPIIADFIAACIAREPDTTPQSPLGGAIRYSLNLRDRLTRYCDHGEAPIDNNDLERLWKPVALGRKNYLFVGSERGGHAAAIAYSIMLTCRLCDLEPFRYLMDVFEAIHAGEDMAAWTPAAYADRLLAPLAQRA